MTNAKERTPAPTVLAFDTSTLSLAAAVMRDGEIVCTMQSFADRNHSVLIVPEIKKLLESAGISASEVDVVAVGRGPGSYTGVRIGVSVAKTLAWTWGKTLLGVSSLETLALGAWESHREECGGSAGTVWIVPAMDARRGQVYTACFAADANGRWERLETDAIRLAAEWKETLANRSAGTEGPAAIWFVGETAPHEGTFRGQAGTGGPEVRIVPFALEAGAVAKLAQGRWLRGEKDDVHSFVPNYTQVTEAEAKLAATARRDRNG